MHHARPLPAYLVQRYQGWKATSFEDNKAWYRRLADEGQRPRAMIISCCDSRVHVTSIFGADQGEFFIHRNVANLVPPYAPDGDHHGTSAAVEYAVTALKVPHIVVLGHSSCGGVKGCHDMCVGDAPELEAETSFVGRWMDILRPGFDRVADISDAPKRVRALEKEGVLVALENLMTFPFVKDAVEAKKLTLHGCWTDIGEGSLEVYDGETGEFSPV
ncbi:carbonic anhydrase [Aliiroseovarius subalbicans]|uniref:carbonic anhydrase n=1 Tax=Aliiroseovarius subalbicans TaxID=2925840 RepID=UPI001F59E801|nr:carbonic anhydrase [Aliiroseovarius subalbicans]MCI2399444.1 carbonic anhydrase [Aliiroseovarius subalbicans]